MPQYNSAPDRDGIVRDLPHNSQLKGDVFLPNTSIADYNDVTQKQNWLSQNGWGYVTLAPGTTRAS